jgi:hypothetical protein
MELRKWRLIFLGLAQRSRVPRRRQAHAVSKPVVAPLAARR